MQIQLNFTNPLLVSAYFDMDMLQIEVREEIFFMANSDLQFISPNYILKAKPIPPLLPNDGLVRGKINEIAGNGSQDGLIVLFIFLALFCFGRFWTLLLMLQIVSNIDNYSMLKIPAEPRMLLNLLEKIANVRVTSITGMQDWIGDSWLSSILIFDEGEELLFSLEIFPFLVFIIWILQKLHDKTNAKYGQKVLTFTKNSLYWSYVIRSFLMTFFATSMCIFNYVF